MAGKRIVISLDGTWNAPNDDGDIGSKGVTNVQKFHNAVLAKGADGRVQHAWYQKGVGTRWYNRLRGGAFGVGLSDNVRGAYRHLVDHWEDGDDVYVLGFSRGAYTARSLVGMIRNCGLLHRKYRRHIGDAEALYRSRDEGADSPTARAFRADFSREIAIRFLGVWDTVGALGVPLGSFDRFNRRYYEFHDTELSGIVEHAYQAVAIDEHRESYAATMWDPKEKPNQTLEQVWFVGAHCDVGGGYADSTLSDLALGWMAEKADACGLGLDPARLPKPASEPWKVAPVDSYSRFLKGAYARLRPRHFRPLGKCAHGEEDVHPTVLTRVKQAPHYRPGNAVWNHVKDAATRFPMGRIW